MFSSSSRIPRSSHMTSREQVRKKFQSDIRRRDVQGKISKMREEMLVMVEGNYNILRNIDLNQTIQMVKKFNIHHLKEDIQILSKIVSDIFTYCCSNSSDHFFQLVDQITIDKLVSLISYDLIMDYSTKPRVYIKILMIVGLYAEYSSYVPFAFIETIRTLFREIVTPFDLYQQRRELLCFNHSQLKKLVEVIFKELGDIQVGKCDLLNYFLDMNDGFAILGLRQAEKLLQFVKRHELSEVSTEYSIFMSILKLFKKILVLDSDQQELMKKILDVDFEIINFVLKVMNLPSKIVQLLQFSVMDAIRIFLLHHLIDNPVILVSHNFEPVFSKFSFFCQKILYHHSKVMDAEERRENHVNIEMICAQKKLLVSLDILGLIFGTNIPVGQQQDSYYKFLSECLNKYVLPNFGSAFSFNVGSMDRIIEKMMDVIINLCLQDIFLEPLLQELTIMNKIFFYCVANCEGVRMKKKSLTCFANMIIIAYDGYSSRVSFDVKQIMEKNNGVGILAQKIGQYADIQLNIQLLTALQCWLKSEVTERSQQNYVWSRFCQNGGINRLERLIEDDGLKKSKVWLLADQILTQFQVSSTLI